MKPHFLTPVRQVLLLAAALLAPLGAFGKAASPTAEADAVLDRWTEAIGGVKRLKAIKQSDYRMRLTVGPGTVLDMQGTVLASGAYRLVAQTPAGELISADDGHVAWMVHASLGGRVEPPKKAERMRRESGSLGALRAREAFPTRRRLADAEIDGKKLQVLELVDRHGETEHWYFNPTTGLRVRREWNAEGKKQTAEVSDFRKIDGILTPFHERSLTEGSVLEVQSVVHQKKVTAEPWRAPEGLEADSKRVEDVLRKFEETIGSAEAIERIKTRVTKSQMDISSNGMSFVTTVSQKAPGKVLVEQDIPGVGAIVQGYDGKTGWAWSEMQGYRELQGPELAQLVGSANIAPRKVGEDTPLRRIVGESTTANGHRLLAVDLSTIAGSAGIFHFDLETGLLMKLETVIQAGPGGSIKVVMDIDDYRETDGVKMAFAQTVSNPAMRMTTKVLEVVHNRELPDDMFLPRKNGKIPAPSAATEPPSGPTEKTAEAAPAAPVALGK
jgi:hypothetical protein